MHSDVSVYVTCYNQESYIRDALQSVFKQTLLPAEIIIIDDASTDNSQKVIHKSIQKAPVLVRFIANKENRGIVRNRNLAKKLFKGDYLVGLDGDDLWFPKKLELELEAIQKFKVDFSFSWHQRFYDEKELQDRACRESKDPSIINDLDERVLLRKYGPSLFRSEMVSREALELTGEYDENLSLYEDYDYKIRLSQKFSGAEVFAITQGYRDNPEGLSKKGIFEHYEALSYIYSKYLKSNKPSVAEAYRSYFYLKLESFLLKAFKNKEISLSTYHKEIRTLRVYNSSLIRLAKSYLIPFKP